MKILTPQKILPLVLVMLPTVKLANGDVNTECMKSELVDNPAYRVFEIPHYPSVRILDGLESCYDTNFVGGISHRYTNESIQKLKQRIIRPEKLISYTVPIENAENVYTESFGYYFAERPAQHGQKRPHLGLDIFASKYARKPKEPVVIKSPIDGVVISQKKARKEDNVISNAVTILGVDGRKYSFDHIARDTDYDTSITLPELGTILHAGDNIGYVGSTGETSMWHLHLIVMTEEQLEKQKNSEMWQELSKNNYCPLRGQVNPLNPQEAGPIAEALLEYKGTKRNIVGNYKYIKAM